MSPCGWSSGRAAREPRGPCLASPAMSGAADAGRGSASGGPRCPTDAEHDGGRRCQAARSQRIASTPAGAGDGSSSPRSRCWRRAPSWRSPPGRGARSPGDSGVSGLVLLGPLTPVEQVGGPPNERPYEAAVRVVRAGSDDVVASARSGADGRFRVNLAPGRYTLIADVARERRAALRVAGRRHGRRASVHRRDDPLRHRHPLTRRAPCRAGCRDSAAAPASGRRCSDARSPRRWPRPPVV